MISLYQGATLNGERRKVMGDFDLDLKNSKGNLGNEQQGIIISGLVWCPPDILDLCQYFGQKFRFYCESSPPLTIRT